MESYNSPSAHNSYSLSAYTRYVAQALSKEPVLLGAWVTAEISDISMSGGHCYMTLIEKDSSGATVARMRATIWSSRFAYIRNKFSKATGRELANGMKVMFYGGANFHSSYGLSFNIGEIDPSYTMGDLERIRREILAALQREGVIDNNRNLKISDPPQKIAIISSANAAGYGDFINQLNNNSSGTIFYPFLFPAVMQGDKTAPSVIAALDIVEQTIPLIQWDCVAIIRGGGATTDMNGFDDLDLARRIATFPIPVLVGIGHERDRCVLDEIACVRCKTPTAVAAWLSDFSAYAWQRASDIATRVATYASERLKGEHIRLQSLETMIPALAENRIKNANLILQKISALLPSIASQATSKERGLLENIATKLKLSLGARLDKEHSRLDNIGKLIQVLSPASTLKRGYSITRVGGKHVTDPSQVKPGDVIETQTAGGIIISNVAK